MLVWKHVDGSAGVWLLQKRLFDDCTLGLESSCKGGILMIQHQFLSTSVTLRPAFLTLLPGKEFSQSLRLQLPTKHQV